MAGAPLIFPIAFGFFQLIFVLCLMNMWFHSAVVSVVPGRIEVASSMLGFQWQKQYAVEEIRDIEMKIGMQSNRKVYYDVHIVRPRRQEVQHPQRHRREAAPPSGFWRW